FSFGDYFKDVAIELAWNLVTREYGLSKERLLATVYAEDDDAHRLWRKIAGLPEDRVIRIASAANFWAMGDLGPCGPCSEIFYDHGAHLPGGPPGSADEDGDRFIEIWNLVFMQFEQVSPTERRPLPRPSIDTGMGLERMTAALQGTHDNYDTDLMRGLIEASAHASGVAADGARAVSHRVIADHVRASAFLIADGVLPSNEGRGYVLRRIMRRAMRHAHLLGSEEPLLWRLVPTLVTEMGQAYPSLARAEALVTETLKLEEARFKRTLGRGLKLLEEETARLSAGASLAGEVAFRLYDTFGFPLDLTEDILRGQGRRVDTAGFESAMERQKRAARAAWTGSGERAAEAVWYAIRESAGATEFLGYEAEVAEGRVQAIVVDGARVDSIEAGRDAAVVVNQTPFYAESGGQVGDVGVMFSADGTEFAIRDTVKRAGDLHVHLGAVAAGRLAVGQVVELRIDRARRAALRANHSATHLLHAALRLVLGEHVTQKGSLVAPDRLRFDFSHPTPLAAEERCSIELEVNRQVRLNGEVVTRFMGPEEATAAGALALFGESYGEEVRVLSMGTFDDRPFSMELCGGTHVARTGEIGAFKIVAEGAVAAGVRRIEALTGEAAVRHAIGRDELLGEIADALKASPAEAPERLRALVEERKRLERELAEARKRLALGGPARAKREAKTFGRYKFVPVRADGVPPRDLRAMVDEQKKQIDPGVVAIVSVNDGSASVVVGVSARATDALDARELLKQAVLVLGGTGGGGRIDMAQGGGPNVERADEALEAIELKVKASVGAA
ncbi:MAG: alanine--tRNA ligase, partial [Alphaproteobacteria bacterium]